MNDISMVGRLIRAAVLSVVLGGALAGGARSAEVEYLPVAPWSGRLVLPAASERRADGGVWIEVENAPASHAGFKGRRAWMTLTPALRSRFAKAVGDVKFDAGTQRQRARGDHAPVRIEGWSKVSPLESLAGARRVDDVRVRLDRVAAASDAADSIELAEVPTEICGTHVGLVKILSVTQEGDLRVRHLERARRSFTGREEVLRTTPEISPAIKAVLGDLPGSPLGQEGWYVRGVPGESGFVVESLEPVSLLAARAGATRAGEVEIRRYIEEENWAGTPARSGQAWSVLVDPQGRGQAFSGRAGERFLVIHNFGGLAGPGGDSKGLVQVAGGHMAYGIARLVPDPFLGTPRLDVTYIQVYGNNPESIISTRLAWHQYMGSLARGWVYRRAVSDVIVELPLLDRPVDVGDGKIRFLDELATHLDVVTALYRIGFGGGNAIITPHNNCSQDSARGLFETVDVLRTIASPRSSSGRVLDPELAAVNALSRNIFRWIVPSGVPSAAWSSGGASGPRRPTTSLSGLFQSRNTIMPRMHAEGMTSLLLDHGARALYVRTNSVGKFGTLPYPIPPQLRFPFIIPPAAP